MDKDISPKDRIICALDVPDYGQALRLVENLYNLVGCFKIGHELTTAIGVPQAISLVRGVGARVMLDTKLHDIPNTMASAAALMAKARVDFFTVHASAGAIGLQAVQNELRKAAELRRESGASDDVPTALAVTVLTSLTGAEAEVLYHRSLDELLHDFAHMAANAGMGIVCSPADVARLRAWRGTRGATLVTPGVRPSWSVPDDQKRFTTPFDAIRHGADYLVVGRPIIAPPDGLTPAEAARKITREIADGLKER